MNTTFLKLTFFLGVCVANYETCFGAAVSQNNPEEFSADIIRKESCKYDITYHFS